MIRVATYVRVSTDDQTTENQTSELRQAVARRAEWTLAAEFCDQGISGAKDRHGRPGFDRLLRAVARREVDLVAVWSVDRLGRSLRDLVMFLEELRGHGCELYLHKQALDTSTPSGRALFGMLGIFAEFERAMTIDRIHAGIARARGAGRTLGRPKIASDREAAVRAALASGLSAKKAARCAGVGVGTAYRIAREAQAQ